jgi:type I restriction enzyme, S subunit
VAVAEWETVLLGDVATLDIDRVALQADEEYRLAGVLIAGQGLFWRATIRGRETNYPALHRLHTGHLVMRKLTAWEGPITTVPPAFDGGHVSSEFPTFTLDKTRLLPEYMRLLCQRPAFHAEMRLRSTGTAERRNRLKPGDLLSIEIELPPIDEQREIASVVAAVEEAGRAALDERDAALAVLHAAVEALVVPTGSWDDLPQHWKLKTLGEVAEVRSGITKGRKTADPVTPIPFLRAANVQGGFLDLREVKTIEVTAAERERFLLEPGDVLMVEGGNAEHLGRGWVWCGEVEGCLHQNHVFRARPDVSVLEPRFLAYAIAASPARAYCLDKAKKTTNLASINKTQISGLPVPLPPSEDQKRIVEALDALREAAFESRKEHEHVVDLRASVVEALASGERRLVPRANPITDLAAVET